MSGSPYIPFYTSDFLGGTSGLTAATKGVYITLICLMYEMESPLLQDWSTLARRCGCSLPAFQKAVAALEDDGKVEVTDDGIWSAKCQKHIAQRRERRSSAKAAAETRWEKTKGKQGMADANAMREQCQPEPEPEPDIREDTYVSSSPSGDLLHANPVAEAVIAYNEAAGRNGWPKVQRVTPSRRKAVLGRIRDAGGVDGWRSAIERAELSDFLCGRTAKPWAGFGFDWICKPANFTKLMEGNYDNRGCGRSESADRQGWDSDTLDAIAYAAGFEGT